MKGHLRKEGMRRRLAPLSAGVGALALIGGGLMAGSTPGHENPRRVVTRAATSSQNDPRDSIMQRMQNEYGSDQTQSLPAATTPPAPAPPTLAAAPPLTSHEVFGFAPYWTLPDSSGFPLGDLTTIAYFSVDVNANGTIDRSGPGWEGYESQDLSDLITQAHAHGDRVVLTATCFDQASLNDLTSSSQAASTLASSLVQLVQAKNLDGVNLDFEGQGSADQVGLDHLVAEVSQTLVGADPHYQLTMDTYASSAADPDGFYDVAGLASYVDAFFVMGYDMDDPSVPSPTAALSGPGFNDSDTLAQYTSVVPASKVILGVPYYGYDWPTTGPALGDPSTGPPTPLSYSQVVAAGHPVYWDSVTQTPWTSYQVGGQWHQTFFDDQTSLDLKAELANSYHIAGVGVWALGMDGNDPSMIAALTGDAPVLKDYSPAPAGAGAGAQSAAGASVTTTTSASASVGPVPESTGSSQGASTPSPTSSKPGATTTSGATTTTATTMTITLGAYTYSGTWEGTSVALSLLPKGVDPLTAGDSVGELTHFSTDDPRYGCLKSATGLPVYAEVGSSDTYDVVADTPAYCVEGIWQFSAPPGVVEIPSTTTTSTAGNTTVLFGPSSKVASQANT